MRNMPTNQGFIQFIIIIVLSVVILSLLGVSIGSFISNTTLRENFAFLWKGIAWVWQNYIVGYLGPAWDFIKSVFT